MLRRPVHSARAVALTVRSLGISRHRRFASAAADISAAAVIKPWEGGESILVAARDFQADDEMFSFTGVLKRQFFMHSLMVGGEAHLHPHEPLEEQPWIYLNHSFSPTVRLSHVPVANAEAPAPLLTATANVDLAAGAMLTIDYTLHEWEISAPFVCAESGREVRGFKHLAEAEQEAALAAAQPHVRSLYLQHLFGQSSRC